MTTKIQALKAAIEICNNKGGIEAAVTVANQPWVDAGEAYPMPYNEYKRYSWLLDDLVRMLAQLEVDARINAHNDLCDQVKAPQHLYAGEELDLTICFERKRFKQLQAQLTDFINKETPRYFAADFVYKVSKSGFVTVWNNVHREWRDINLSIVNLINMGAMEVTEADINAYTTINNETRKIALSPTLAAICQKIFDAGFDCRIPYAACRVLSERDLGYWNEFIACALPSDWLVWANEDCVSHHMKIEMTEYYNDALNALRKI